MATTLCFRHLLTPAGFVSDKAVHVGQDGRIGAITDWDGRGEQDGWLALPGMPNAHSHVFQRALAGYGEARAGEDSFWSWRAAMYRLANGLEPEDLAIIARVGFTAMLRAGFTSVAEFHYLHRLPGAGPAESAGIIARAAADAGIRLRLLPVFYETGDFETPPRPEQGRFVHAGVDEFLETLDALRAHDPGLALHSLRAVAPASAVRLIDAADTVLADGAPFHVHAAEQLREVEACRQRFGCGPVALLARHVALGPRWSVVHATHADEGERRLMVAAGATVVLCPLTEAYLGDGIFPARTHGAAGGALAVGSDSNVRLDAVEELRLLEYGQRLTDRARARLADREGLGAPLWTRLAEGGRAALGLDVGRLETGSLADLVILDPADGDLLGCDDPRRVLDALITAGDRGAIREVFVGGRRVVTRPDPDLAGEYRERVGRLMEESS